MKAFREWFGDRHPEIKDRWYGNTGETWQAAWERLADGVAEYVTESMQESAEAVISKLAADRQIIDLRNKQGLPDAYVRDVLIPQINQAAAEGVRVKALPYYITQHKGQDDEGKE